MRFIGTLSMFILLPFLFACSDPYDENMLRKRCEATPCMDSLCLHWSPELKRCGVPAALIVEYYLKNKERVENISEENDSLKKELSILKYQNDSLLERKEVLLERYLNVKKIRDSLEREKVLLLNEVELIRVENKKVERYIDDLQKKQGLLLFSLLEKKEKMMENVCSIIKREEVKKTNKIFQK